MKNEKFVSLEEQINSYDSLPFDDKLNLLRKLSKDITYNSDYQFKVCDYKLFSKIILDIKKLEEENFEEEKVLLYTKIFLMFLHNELGNETSIQIKIYNEIFKGDSFINFKNILQNKNKIKDLKAQKFLLGIIFKIFIQNTKILTECLCKEDVDFFIFLLMNINYEENYKNNLSNKDIQEINDWIIIIFSYILKIKEYSSLLQNKTLFIYLLDTYKDNEKVYLLLIEIFRDVIEYSKQNKTMVINLSHIELLSNLLLNEIESLEKYFQSLKDEELFKSYERISKEDLNYSNKKIICLIDIISVFLITEDLDNALYKEKVFKILNESKIIKQIIFLIRKSDGLYDTVFLRNKALKKEEIKNIKVLPNDNLFYGFQTNLMKLFTNLSFKNQFIKQYFLDNPTEFYYFLNHLKMDKCNPLKKEWAVLLIKSLCHKCTEIQNYIKDLKPIEMDPFLKDYIINKGQEKIEFGNEYERRIFFDLLQKKEKGEKDEE